MKNRNVVKQDYRLNNARYKLDTNEMKFIAIAIAQIDTDDDELKEYEVKISELEAKLQAEQNETRLKRFAKKIMSKPLEVPTSTGWEVYNWFSKIEYVRNEAKFKVQIHKDLRVYLLDFKKRFVKYNLKYILALTSNYAIRIYQLLKEYEKVTKRTFTVEELQDILQVPKSYKAKYNDFKKRILKVAEKELIEHCDIFFEYEEIKINKKVTEILFRIKKNVNVLKQEQQQARQQTFKDTELDKDLQKYIGKVLYLNGFDFKIISISKKDNKYSVSCHEVDDKNYIKTFEISEAQLNAAK